MYLSRRRAGTLQPLNRDQTTAEQQQHACIKDLLDPIELFEPYV